jgi:hypothetical protein
MKQPENEQKNKNLNNSMQFSQKTFNHQLILTDYNIYNIIDNNNNNSYKTIKIKKPKNDLNNSNLMDKKNKIVVNYNLSKIHPNIVAKNLFPNYAMKTLVAHKTNNSLENKNITDINKNKKKGRKIIQNPVNSKIVSYSSHTKEKSNFKANLKKNKNSESKDKNFMVIQNGGRMNRNLNLTLTNFSSIGGTEFKKDILDKSPKQYNLSISNKHDKKINDEIIIKRKSLNTNKNKLNKKIFGKMNLNDINNYNLNLNNFDNINININNNSTLSNKNSNNNSLKFQKRKSNKTNLSSSSSKFYGSSLKSNSKYSVNKKFDILKNNMNEQINDINKNYNKLKNMTESDNVKKHELIFDIIQNSLFKFSSLLSNPKEKEVAFEIIKKLNDFFKKNTTLVNAIKKKNDELNEKIRKCKDINKHIEKENILLVDKIDIMQRKIDDLENEIKNNIFNDNGNNIDNGNVINNIKVNNTIFENGNDYIQEQNENENENDDSYDKEENESSVNSEELESIRFFDKIIMKKHSFSKAHIPELEIKQIKLNEELENKQNHNGKVNNYKLRNKSNLKNGIDIYKQKDKEFQNGLRKKGNKSSKAIGYSRIAEDKKKKSYKKFQGIK